MYPHFLDWGYRKPHFCHYFTKFGQQFPANITKFYEVPDFAAEVHENQFWLPILTANFGSLRPTAFGVPPNPLIFTRWLGKKKDKARVYETPVYEKYLPHRTHFLALSDTQYVRLPAFRTLTLSWTAFRT